MSYVTDMRNRRNEYVLQSSAVVWRGKGSSAWHSSFFWMQKTKTLNNNFLKKSDFSQTVGMMSKKQLNMADICKGALLRELLWNKQASQQKAWNVKTVGKTSSQALNIRLSITHNASLFIWNILMINMVWQKIKTQCKVSCKLPILAKGYMNWNTGKNIYISVCMRTFLLSLIQFAYRVDRRCHHNSSP